LRARSEDEACNLQASNLYRENALAMLHLQVNSSGPATVFPATMVA
jgi:hypothetical protein